MTPCETASYIRRPFNQIASFAPSVAAMYSTAIVDRAAISCRDAFQEIAPAHSVKIKPEVERLRSRSQL